MKPASSKVKGSWFTNLSPVSVDGYFLVRLMKIKVNTRYSGGGTISDETSLRASTAYPVTSTRLLFIVANSTSGS